MPKPYSYDLRKKVFQYIESGKTIIEASKAFNISRKVIFDWKKLKNETGSIKPKDSYQKGHSHKITNIEEFKNFLEKNKDKSCHELASLYHKPICSRTIWKTIKKLNYSYKKNFSSP